MAGSGTANVGKVGACRLRQQGARGARILFAVIDLFDPDPQHADRPARIFTAGPVRSASGRRRRIAVINSGAERHIIASGLIQTNGSGKIPRKWRSSAIAAGLIRYVLTTRIFRGKECEPVTAALLGF